VENGHQVMLRSKSAKASHPNSSSDACMYAISLPLTPFTSFRAFQSTLSIHQSWLHVTIFLICSIDIASLRPVNSNKKERRRAFN